MKKKLIKYICNNLYLLDTNMLDYIATLIFKCVNKSDEQL